MVVVAATAELYVDRQARRSTSKTRAGKSMDFNVGIFSEFFFIKYRQHRAKEILRKHYLRQTRISRVYRELARPPLEEKDGSLIKSNVLLCIAYRFPDAVVDEKEGSGGARYAHEKRFSRLADILIAAGGVRASRRDYAVYIRDTTSTTTRTPGRLRVTRARANATGYAFLRNVSNMSDNVRHRYVGIRERIGNRSSRGQRDAPKTNVPIIPGDCV